MLVSVYLHKPIAETLKCFGDLSNVINKIYDAAGEGTIDVMDKPKVPSREGASRYDIDITSEYYMELLVAFPANSSRISIRRLLYWFVENEVYELLNWEPVHEYVSIDKERILKKLNHIYSLYDKMYMLLSTEERLIANPIKNNLIQLEEVIKNGR